MEQLVMAPKIEVWLVKKSWRYTRDQFKSRSVFEAVVTMQNGKLRTVFYARESQHFFGVYVYAPFNIAPEKRSQILEMIAAANYGYQNARFELNPETGELRCGSTAVLPNSHLSMEMIEGMTSFVLEWMNSFLPTLSSINGTGWDRE